MAPPLKRGCRAKSCSRWLERLRHWGFSQCSKQSNVPTGQGLRESAPEVPATTTAAPLQLIYFGHSACPKGLGKIPVVGIVHPLMAIAPLPSFSHLHTVSCSTGMLVNTTDFAMSLLSKDNSYKLVADTFFPKLYTTGQCLPQSEA